MLPREEFKTATDRMQEKHNAGGNRQLEAAMQRGRVLFNRIGFGGEESSVIKASQLPIVNDMLRRLREKYHDTLQRHSTDAILIQLENYIRFEIEKAKAAKDEQREFDFTKALNVLIAADSHLRKHENPNQSGIVHNTALREVLALMWLAASDMNMILLPTREREILQLSESERSDARQKIIKEESVDNVFILTLKEIRRAHNADTPERSLDKVNDFQSCAIGTFGRLILNSAPLNCVAALTVEMNLHPADLERSSVELANIQVPNIDFSRIPRLCEEFICEQLQERSADVKEAIYRSMNEFINNDVEYQDVTGSNIQMNIARLAEYKRIHRLFSDSLKPTISYEEFMTFMDIHAPGYVSALMQIDEVPSLLRIYDEYVQAITPVKIFIGFTSTRTNDLSMQCAKLGETLLKLVKWAI